MPQSPIAPVPSAVPTPAASLRAAPPRRAGSRPALVAAAASILVHLFLFLAVRFEFILEPRPARPPVHAYRLSPAMQAYQINPVNVGPGEIEPVLPPPRLELPEQRLTVPPPRPAPGGPPATDARPPSLGERLGRTPTADLELWRPVAPGSYERPLTEEEVLRARLAARMAAYNDSVAAAGLAADRATDWTVKDGSGGKWGVSPGKVHLGGITLPLPVAFTPPPGRREEVANRTRSWSETQAQAARAEAEDNFDARVKAIRERRAAARDSARDAGN